MPEAGRSPLRAVSYNVHGCVGLDGHRDEERVARVLAELGPDVVGLQEVFAGSAADGAPTQLDALARASGLHAVHGPTLAHERGPYGNALLCRQPLRGVRRADLSLPGVEPRGAVGADLELEGGGQLHAVVTHFGLRGTERTRQADRLLDWLADRATGPLVLLGDFNEWRPLATPLRRLRAALGPGRAVRSFPSRRPLLALDRIYACGGARVTHARAHRSALARVASDHLPVCATLQLDAASDPR